MFLTLLCKYLTNLKVPVNFDNNVCYFYFLKNLRIWTSKDTKCELNKFVEKLR